MSPADAGVAHVSVARATLGGFGALPGTAGRAALAVVAIALGVALGFAVQLINHTAIAEFNAGLATLSGDADLQIQGSRAGFAQGVYPIVARDPAVAIASPVIQLEASVFGADETLTLLGVDVLRAAAVTPALVGESDERFDTLRPDTVFLSPAAAAWLHRERGDTVELQNGVDTVPLRVAGSVHAEAGARLAVMDIGALQDRFARAGRITRIDVRVRPGHDPAALAQRLAQVLPAGVAAVAPRSNLESTARLTRAYRVNLDVLALVALFTGGLLVFSTQALSVMRRRVPFALLRSLGLTRGALVRLVLREGAVLGAIGAIVGLAAGWAIASLTTRWLGLDLGAGFFRGRAPGIAMDWNAAVVFGLVGVAAAMLGSVVPAREAARASPAIALKAGDVDVEWGHGRSAWPAVAALLLGALAALLPPVLELPIFGYGAIALLLLGTLRLLPYLSGILLAAVPAPRATPAALALAQIRHTPAQATLSLAAIVAGVSLMAAMAVMVASFRGSLEDWLMHVLPADVYLRAGTGSDTAYLTPELQRAIAAVPGVERVEFLRVTSLALEAGAPRVTLLARDIDRDRPESRLAFTGATITPTAGDPPPAWISEAAADRFGWRTGQVIRLPLADRFVPFTVAGIWRDYARQQGAIAVERAVYARSTGDDWVNDAALWLVPGASLDALRARIEALAGADRLELATPGDLRAISLRIFDRTFAVTYALEAVAVLIGLTGLSSAFGALVLARRREFGVLRHIGMTRRQVGTMLGVEGLALAAVGVAVGLALGFVIALILIHVVNRQSFHWSMDLVVPWAGLAALAAALLLLATLTAWLAGRQAMSEDAVLAVKEDW
jgi:putative ABC transport system permease protein